MMDTERKREEDEGDEWKRRDCEKEITDRNTEEEKHKEELKTNKTEIGFTNPVLGALCLALLSCYTLCRLSF